MRYLLKWIAWGLLASIMIATGAIAQTMEYDTDRVGGDYAREALSADDPNLCAALCKEDARCVAFTFTPTGFNEWEKPLCWMKDSQPAKFPRTSAVSGYFSSRLAGAPDIDEVRQQSLEDSIAWCEDSPVTQTDQDLLDCYTADADMTDNSLLCDIQGGVLSVECHELLGSAQAAECWAMDDPQESAECYLKTAVEHPSVLGCQGAPEYIRGECLMIVAVERKDPDIVLSNPDMPDEERDTIAATYAIMAQDYGALDLIYDDGLYNKALMQVTVNRIGAGKPVDPQACNKMAGGAFGQVEPGTLGTNPDSALCRTAVAFAHAVSDYAETATLEQMAQIEHVIDAYSQWGDERELLQLPPSLYARFKEYETATGAGAVSTTSSASPTPYYPDTEDMDLSTPDSGGCLLGQC